jgi:MYXO-CTERM domain-containing protein
MQRLGLAIVLSLVACDGPSVRSIEVGDGVVTRDGGSLGGTRIGLSRIGRGALHDVIDGVMTRAGAEVHLVRGAGITEWWRAQGAGLEQGVTIDARPNGDGSLVLEMQTSSRASGADVITLHDDHDVPVATYSALAVVDATGRAMPAQMRALDHTIRIEVDDAGAIYPLVVDPTLTITWEATVPPPAGYSTMFARALDISEDGTRLIAGDSGASAATIFVRNGATWTQETQLSAATLPNLGGSVSISADGSLAAVTYGSAASNTTAVAVFSRSGTAWTQTATALPPVFSHNFVDLDLSGDGTRLFVHCYTGFADLVSVYDLSTAGATYETDLALGCRPVASTDGTRVLGCNAAGGGTAAIVFSSVGTTWNQEYVATGTSGSQYLTPGGDYFLAGTGSGGSVYARSGTSWTLRASIANGARVLSSDGALAMGQGTTSVWNGTAYVAGPTFAPRSAGGFVSPIVMDALGVRIAVTDSNSNVEVFVVARNDATLCSADAECVNGHCNDGVCCHTDCGNSTTDCHACTVAAGGSADGTCTALTPSFAPNVTCRPVAGPCDIAEACVTGSIACPVDGFANGITCRASGNACALAATCGGTSATCPANPAGNAGTVCRAMNGACDVAESCDGATPICPPDGFAPATTMCHLATDLCDTTLFCSGTSGSCPPDAFQPSTHMCRSAAGMGCDVPSFCTGSTTSCPPNQFLPSGTQCGTRMVSGVCDAHDVCTGNTANCPHAYLTGVVCRAAAGACDVAESCSGTSVNCPPDAVEGGGTVCRASTGSCDPAESCDGTTTMCPADVNMCATHPDMGVAHDAGSASDAATSDAGGDAGGDGGASDASASDASMMQHADAAPSPPAAGGCACRASRSGSSGWLALVVLGLAARRRSRACPSPNA